MKCKGNAIVLSFCKRKCHSVVCLQKKMSQCCLFTKENVIVQSVCKENAKVQSVCHCVVCFQTKYHAVKCLQRKSHFAVCFKVCTILLSVCNRNAILLSYLQRNVCTMSVSQSVSQSVQSLIQSLFIPYSPFTIVQSYRCVCKQTPSIVPVVIYWYT